MQVRLLGQVEVTDDASEDLALGGATQRRVLAGLALRRNDVVSLPYLVDVIWSEGDVPGRADHNVRTYVHRLRSALAGFGDRVETVGAGYRLRLDDDELDAARFEWLARTAGGLADTRDTLTALDAIDEAERLWRGPPVEEFRHEQWAVPEVARLTELRSELRTRQAEVLLDAGRSGDAVVTLEGLVRDEPFRERPRALFMRALYESGRQAEALRAFQEFRRSLIEEIGVVPSTELVDLDRRIVSGDLPTVSSTTRSVGGYELHERIGEGAFAIVHRATQESLGREVAIKIIRAELANRPEFIRRFEAEAKMVARIEHPNVVPLYDYWREPDRAFLVMRWMTGGSLETRLDDGRWSLDDTLVLVGQIAAALDAAHEQGVVHRDVKPENILFDDAGRAYLGDFGIALGAEERSRPEAALSEGSPIFASPEQLRREPAGPEADVHSLAIVAFTLLVGRTPFADAPDAPTLLQRQLHEPIPRVHNLRTELPEAIDEVLEIATAKDPAGRHPTATAFAAALRAAASPSAAANDRLAAVRRRANPYKGLRAFDETDAADFYGRDRLVDELIGHLGRPDNRTLAVVGPSGSGKSSVVQAGLIPALRAGRVPGSSHWFTTTMIPGTRPFEALETALLRVAVNPPASLLEQLRDSERGILRAVRRILPTDDGVVVIVIDQFEELFTGEVPDQERDLFLRALSVAVTEPGSPARVLLTLRADFYDRPLRHPAFAPLLKEHAVVVTPLAPDELEHAIVAPAAAVGVDFEPGLVAEIISDVNGEPGALPLLQYALTQAFDATDGDTITIDGYRSIGGLAGALGRRAEELWCSAGAEERQVVRRLFGRLVTLGEGIGDTRRRVLMAEVTHDPEIAAAVDRFGRARLLTVDRDAATREPTVEIAHEALIREWPRLRSWLDDDRDGLRVHRHLTETAVAWIASGRDVGELYRGGRLETAWSWADDHADDLNESEGEFLGESVAANQAELVAEQQRFDEQIRSNRRLRLLVAVASTIAVIAAVAGVFALEQRSRANDEAAIADEQRALGDLDRLLASARGAESADPTVGLLLAVEAQRIHQDSSAMFPEGRSIETSDALHRALTARKGFNGWLATDDVGDITVLDDGERLATHTADTIEIWNVATRTLEVSWPYPDPAELNTGIEFLSGVASKDGSYFAASDPTGVTVVDLATGDTIHRLERQSFAWRALALSPNGSRLAAAFDNSVEVWRLDGSAELVASIERPAPVGDIEWDPGGSALAIGAWDSGVALWEPDADATVWETPAIASPDIDNGAWGLLFSGDGQRLLVSSQTADAVAIGRPSGVRAVRVLDARTGDELGAVADPATRASMAWLDGSERTAIAVSFAGGPLSLFDVGGGDVREIGQIGATKQGASPGLGVLPALGMVATGGANGIEIRSVGGSSPLSVLAPLAAEQKAAINPRRLLLDGFSDDGHRLVTSLLLADAEPYVVDLDSTADGPEPVSVAFDAADARRVKRYGDVTLWVTGDGYVVREGLEGPQIGTTLPHPELTPGSVALSPDGDRLVLVERGQPTLYDMTSGEIVTRLDAGFPFVPLVVNAKFSLDGTVVNVWDYLSASAGFDAQTGELRWATRDFRMAVPGRSSDEITTVSGFTDPVIQVRSATPPFEAAGDPLVAHQSGTAWHEMHPERSWLASEGRDGTVRVWDLETRSQIGRPLPKEQAGSISWSPDGRLLAVPTPAGFEVWNFDTDTWADVACEIAGRNLTRAEWEAFGPRTVEYRQTCEQYPIDV